MVTLASTDSKLAQHITNETAARHIKLICLVAPEHIHCHADNSIYHTTLGCIYTYMTYYDSQYLKSLLPQLEYKC